MFQSGGKSECMWKLVWWTTTDIFNHLSVYIYGNWIIGKRLSLETVWQEGKIYYSYVMYHGNWSKAGKAFFLISSVQQCGFKSYCLISGWCT